VDPRPDSTLTAAVLAGDVEAFAPLVHRYSDGCARFAVRMLGSRDDAEDVLQSVWLRAYRNLASCKDPARFRAWLFQIVVNECRTFASRDGRRETTLVRGDAAFDGIAAGQSNGDGELREKLQRAIDQLPPDQREAFLLKHIEEMEYEEMAGLTGTGVSALKMRVKRACERLRELLEGVPHE
jgi:RNA polymerase sigma-70 factor (ECF subfamily)